MIERPVLASWCKDFASTLFRTPSLVLSQFVPAVRLRERGRAIWLPPFSRDWSIVNRDRISDVATDARPGNASILAPSNATVCLASLVMVMVMQMDFVKHLELPFLALMTKFSGVSQCQSLSRWVLLEFWTNISWSLLYACKCDILGVGGLTWQELAGFGDLPR